MNNLLLFLKKFMYLVLLLVFFGVVGYLVVVNYSFLFSKKVEGQVIAVDRVTHSNMVMGNAVVKASNVLHLFAVSVKNDKGEIFIGRSEDPQWSIVQKGNCVTAVYYPYPPWQLDKANTYFNVILKAMKECPAGTPPPPEEPTESAPTSETAPTVTN